MLTPKVIEGIYTNYDDHIKEVISLLKDEDRQNKLRTEGFEKAVEFGWGKIVRQWEAIFSGNI